MSVTQEQVVDYIKNLKLSQVKDLIKVLETELGVEASAPIVMGAVAAPAAGAAAPAEEEKSAFDVVMTSFGAEKIKVIKKVREITGLGLKEAKDLVENVPAKIKEGVAKAEAQGIIEALQAEGATVEMK